MCKRKGCRGERKCFIVLFTLKIQLLFLKPEPQHKQTFSCFTQQRSDPHRKQGRKQETDERERESESERDAEEGNKAIKGTWGFPFCRIR